MKIGINVYPLIAEHKNRGIGRYTRNLLEYLEKNSSIEIVKFTDINAVKGVDIVHYPWFDLFFHTLPILSKYPTVVTVHDVMPLMFPKFYPSGIKGKFNFLLQKIALQRCDFVITDSEVSKKDIGKYLRIDRKKIETILLASDKKKVEIPKNQQTDILRKYGLNNSFLLYVGDCNYVKNTPFLIEGFNKILQKSPFSRINLVLVGDIFLKPNVDLNHPELKSIKKVNELISEYSLEKKIIRVGNINDQELMVLYKYAEAYIQPSLYEGFGMPVLEAMEAGTPVLSSDGGSLPEVGGGTPVYFNPTDIDDFVFKLDKVMSDSKLRIRMTKNGIKRAAEFSWDKVAYQTVEIYKKVLSKNV